MTDINPLVSICIPTYEMHGKGIDYLTHSFNVIAKQTYKKFEVVISDNSKDDGIKNLCQSWSNTLPIRHHFNRQKYGLSGNTNHAMKLAKGDLIKILYQDDYLLDGNSLFHQVFHFMGNYNHWLVSACCHTKDGINLYNPIYPKYHDNIQFGENTISCPSVLLFKNENVLEFDENLCWLMDVDYYKRLYDKFGLPSICNYVTIVNREHLNQTSLTLNELEKSKDFKYIKNKYYEKI
jgi:glycosyltransferase involved in cell wall biosynthesis